MPDAPISNRTMPSCSIIPVLAYHDVEDAIEWLCKTFGFTERWRAGNHRAQLNFGNCTMVVTSMVHGNPYSPARLTAAIESLNHSMLVKVDDVNRHYEHALHLGANILQAPANFPYGERQYTVEDIGGHRWTFSQSIADLAPEDWGGTSSIDSDLT